MRGVSYPPASSPGSPGYPAYGATTAADPTAVMGRRIAAFLLDLVVVFAALLITIVITGPTRYTDAGSDFCDSIETGTSNVCVETNGDAYVWTQGEAVAMGLVPFLVGMGNHLFVEGFAGGTIGKLLVGLRVVREDGRVAGFGRVLVRYLLLLVALGLSIIFFLGVIVELIVACVTKPHRRIGDRAAGTYVVGKADVGRPVRRPSTWATGPWVAQPQWGTQPGQPTWGPPPGQPGQPGPPAWGAPPPRCPGAGDGVPGPRPPRQRVADPAAGSLAHARDRAGARAVRRRPDERSVRLRSAGRRRAGLGYAQPVAHPVARAAAAPARVGSAAPATAAAPTAAAAVGASSPAAAAAAVGASSPAAAAAAVRAGAAAAAEHARRTALGPAAQGLDDLGPAARPVAAVGRRRPGVASDGPMTAAVLLACGCGGRVAQGVVVWGTTITAGASAVIGGLVATRRARRHRAVRTGAPDDPRA